MSNKFDHLFDPAWSEIKINKVFFHEIDNVKNNPGDLEELQQAFFKASAEHDRRLTQLTETKNIWTLE